MLYGSFCGLRTYAADEVHEIPDLLLGELSFVQFHIGRCAVTNYNEDLAVARTVVPGFVGEICGCASGQSHPAISLSCRTVARSAMAAVEFLSIFDRCRISGHRILQLCGFRVALPHCHRNEERDAECREREAHDAVTPEAHQNSPKDNPRNDLSDVRKSREPDSRSYSHRTRTDFS